MLTSLIQPRTRSVPFALLALGIALSVLAAIAFPVQAQTFTTLYSFKGAPDGGSPHAGVVVDANGTLYGTTGFGGSSSACTGGCGTVFKVTASGKETVLHSFNQSDGSYPEAVLFRDAKGNLYGTADLGGSAGAGTVFKLDTSGNYTVLHTFTDSPDGAFPGNSSLIRDSAGNLYGVTLGGGDNPSGGILYKLDSTGKEVRRHSFPAEGTAGRYGLVRDSAGSFYGTTTYGNGYGTVYKVDPSGQETLVYAFKGGTDGQYPWAPVICDSGGNLYGTTVGDYYSPHFGTVFKVDAAGNETVLHNFTLGADGGRSYAGLVRDAAGNLYGTTTEGGAYGWGTIFKVDAAGNFTVLYDFTGGKDGRHPWSLTLDTAGNLYGTTAYGGVFYAGTVFKITF